MSRVEELVKTGATIIDIRSPEKFLKAHATASLNIPFDDIPCSLQTIKSIRGPILVCCSKGVLSEKVACYLEIAGIEAYNAGPWTRIAAIRNQEL